MTRVSTIRIAMAISVQIASLALSASLRPSAAGSKKYYTVQVLAVTAENKQTILPIYESLRAKGYFVYYCPANVGDRRFLRLRTGLFENPEQAGAYALQMRQSEGFDPFIAQADVPVTRFRNLFSVVTTPSGLWLMTNSSARELYTPAAGMIDDRWTKPQISPDGAAMVFYDNARIVKVPFREGPTQILRETAPKGELLNSIVHWSPDGQYIAYLDAVAWEVPTRLWIMRADGSANRCLIGDETSQTKVKSFQWHPKHDRIFYVVGPTYGTASRGGSLCSVDLDGTRQTVVEASADSGIEVVSDFRIADGLLYYRTVQHDPNGKDLQYTAHQRAIGGYD